MNDMKNIYWVLVDKNGEIDHEEGEPLVFCQRRYAIDKKKSFASYYRNLKPRKCEIKLL